ncbi:hypothetical protein RM780_11440 [Streptomyces sp. DSM 44917]|uniref:Uncharacterized protein n=1 Tax=Streptomyces boetiae TaxID=3075541 RepID=A0ABU2L7M3_9ACTN|nr:hypothetical protein [Streptomyces sp. DSM 44917]MDT0307574.1 hypothetical protein [Streptomyces sp. DSM 44917]
MPTGVGLTYAALLDADLGPLRAAAERWQRVRDALAEMYATARHDMAGRALGADWRGRNADVTRPFVVATGRGFAAGHEQAHAVHSVLDRLHADLTRQQAALREVAETAAARGVYIDPAGEVHPQEDRALTLTGAQTLGAPLSEGVVAAMEEVRDRIRQHLRLAAECDRLASGALTELAERSGPDGRNAFAASPFADAGEAYAELLTGDAEAFARLARREDLTERDLEAMNRLLALHAENPLFAAHLVDTLGMDAYLRLPDRVDRAADGDGQTSAALREGLGTALSASLAPAGDMSSAPPGSEAFEAWLATPEGRAYRERYDAFHEAGARELFRGPDWERTADGRVGYDAAFDLLDASRLPIDDQFFHQTADHLIALEREQPGIWNDDRFVTTREDGRPLPGWADPREPENDLVDRLLGIGAHSNPQAVTAFFDPGRPEGEAHLDYFIGQGPAARHVADAPGIFRLGEPTPPGPGLQAALEAAATGLPPGDPPPQGVARTHTEAQRAVAEAVWNAFAEDYTASDDVSEIHPPRIADGEPFADLRPALGNIAADYMRDVQRELTGVGPDVPEGAAVDFDMVGPMLSDIGTDPEGYAAVTAANEATTYVAIDQAVHGDWESRQERRTAVADAVVPGAQIAGLMTDARATAVYERHIAAQEDYNATVDQVHVWTDRALSIAIDAPLAERFPVAGEAAGVLRGVLTDQIFATLERDDSATAAMQRSREYSASRDYFREQFVTGAVNDAFDRGGVPEEHRTVVTDGAALQADASFNDGIANVHGEG